MSGIPFHAQDSANSGLKTRRQHDDFGTGLDPAARAVGKSCRIEYDPDRGLYFAYDVGRDQSHFYWAGSEEEERDPEDTTTPRDAGAWSPNAASIVAQVAVPNTYPPIAQGLTPLRATLVPSQSFVLPLLKPWTPDDRFKPLPLVTGGAGSLVYPRLMPGRVTAAFEDDRQVTVWSPDFVGLVAPARAGDPRAGTIVYDLDATGALDYARAAHLHQLTQVVDLGAANGGMTLALLNSYSRLDGRGRGLLLVDHRWGVVGSNRHPATAGAFGGGFVETLVVSGDGKSAPICVHQPEGTDADGRPILPIHLNRDAPVLGSGGRDGPVFDDRQTFQPVGTGAVRAFQDSSGNVQVELVDLGPQLWVECFKRFDFDLGVWRYQVPLPWLGDVDLSGGDGDEPERPTTGTPQQPGRTTTRPRGGGGGGGGGGGPGPGPGPQPQPQPQPQPRPRPRPQPRPGNPNPNPRERRPGGGGGEKPKRPEDIPEPGQIPGRKPPDPDEDDRITQPERDDGTQKLPPQSPGPLLPDLSDLVTEPPELVGDFGGDPQFTFSLEPAGPGLLPGGQAPDNQHEGQYPPSTNVSPTGTLQPSVTLMGAATGASQPAIGAGAGAAGLSALGRGEGLEALIDALRTVVPQTVVLDSFVGETYDDADTEKTETGVQALKSTLSLRPARVKRHDAATGVHDPAVTAESSPACVRFQIPGGFVTLDFSHYAAGNDSRSSSGGRVRQATTGEVANGAGMVAAALDTSGVEAASKLILTASTITFGGTSLIGGSAINGTEGAVIGGTGADGDVTEPAGTTTRNAVVNADVYTLASGRTVDSSTVPWTAIRGKETIDIDGTVDQTGNGSAGQADVDAGSTQGGSGGQGNVTLTRGGGGGGGGSAGYAGAPTTGTWDGFDGADGADRTLAAGVGVGGSSTGGIGHAHSGGSGGTGGAAAAGNNGQGNLDEFLTIMSAWIPALGGGGPGGGAGAGGPNLGSVAASGAKGANGTNGTGNGEGGGGGGGGEGGGMIVLETPTDMQLTNATLNAAGNAGGNGGNGSNGSGVGDAGGGGGGAAGGGGGGVIAKILGPSTATVSGSPTESVTGGSAGSSVGTGGTSPSGGGGGNGGTGTAGESGISLTSKLY